MNFTLKVVDDKASGCLIADTLHEKGGFDALQEAAFAHLVPDGQCDWLMRELLYDMAELHGWKVSVTERAKPTEASP